MIKTGLILFLYLSFAFSQEKIDLNFLKQKPVGIARDFYIWSFLQDPKTSLNDAIQAYQMVFRKNPKIEKLLAQKGYIHELPKDIRCKQLPIQELKNEDAECISFGIKLSHIPSISSIDAQKLTQKIENINPILAQEIAILQKKDILQASLKSQNAQIFSEIFYGLNQQQRVKWFDHQIDSKQFEILANQNHPNFNKMLQYLLLSDHFKHIKRSILQSQITQVDEKILLLLGIIHLKNKNKNQALHYFKLAFNEGKNPLTRDKALFWQYRISKDHNLLKQLAQSTQLNLYTIYATQTLKTKPRYTIISKLNNIKSSNANFNISDPFEWQLLRENFLKIPTGDELKPLLDQSLAHSNSQPHFAFMLNRIKKFRNNYFLMPYSQMLTWQNPHQKALTYAIAKQESHLIPALVSTSYALGMMQIMPFNLDPIAKALGKQKMRFDDLFKPEIALEFGRYYLKELEDEFKHPLFVAYAYNGGPGFWRRTLNKKTLFIKGREYDPWLSLELIPYEESKNYGPLVLTNYVIYQQLLGNHINLDTLLSQTLVNLSKKENND